MAWRLGVVGRLASLGPFAAAEIVKIEIWSKCPDWTAECRVEKLDIYWEPENQTIIIQTKIKYLENVKKN